MPFFITRIYLSMISMETGREFRHRTIIGANQWNVREITLKWGLIIAEDRADQSGLGAL